MDDVKKITNTEAIQTETPRPGNSNRKKQKKKQRQGKAVKGHLEELTRIVEETHRELEKEDSPFRICVYQDGDDIFVDIVAVDRDGKTKSVLKQDISHSELEAVIAHIKTGRGLLLDSDA